MLGRRLSDEPYSGEDVALLASVGTQAGLALENIRLAETMAERMEAERRIARDLEIARDVQSKLLPQDRPPLSTLDYAGACLQARIVGGDYFDFVSVGTGQFGLVLADISGKGISAALLMATLQANLRAQYAQAPHDLARCSRDREQGLLRLDRREPLRDAVLRRLRRGDARAALRQLRPPATDPAPRDRRRRAAGRHRAGRRPVRIRGNARRARCARATISS